MEKRKTLISEIKNFIEKSISQHNTDGTVNKSEYFNLLNRVSEISDDDFDSLDTYSYFMKFTFEPDRRMKRNLVEKEFEENYLDKNSFLILINDLQGILNWLDK